MLKSQVKRPVEVQAVWGVVSLPGDGIPEGVPLRWYPAVMKSLPVVKYVPYVQE